MPPPRCRIVHGTMWVVIRPPAVSSSYGEAIDLGPSSTSEGLLLLVPIQVAGLSARRLIPPRDVGRLPLIQRTRSRPRDPPAAFPQRRLRASCGMGCPRYPLLLGRRARLPDPGSIRAPADECAIRPCGPLDHRSIILIMTPGLRLIMERWGHVLRSVSARIKCLDPGR